MATWEETYTKTVWTRYRGADRPPTPISNGKQETPIESLLLNQNARRMEKSGAHRALYNLN